MQHALTATLATLISATATAGPIDLTGHWVGFATGGGCTYHGAVDLVHIDSDVTGFGTITLTAGQFCPPELTGSTDGTYDGFVVTFGMATKQLGEVVFTGSVSPDGNTMNGMWEMIAPPQLGGGWIAFRDLGGGGNGPDADLDGIPDDWEDNGIPYADISGELQRYTLPGANWQRKDLYVEVDAAQGLSLSDTAKQILEAVFQNAPNANPDGSTGITLHIERDETDLDIDDPWPTDGCWPTDFDSHRAVSFGSVSERGDADANAVLAAKAKVFRYCILGPAADNTTLGCSAILSSEFVVYAGAAYLTNGVGDDDEQVAATFMHELGHAMGIEHGGGDQINGKPNYPSVMNYATNFRYDWNRTFWRLDFSRAGPDDLATLNELALDETAGLGSAAGFYWADKMPFGVNVDTPNGLARLVRYVHLDGRPTDFGDVSATGYPDGRFDTSVEQDLNHVDLFQGVNLPGTASPGDVMVAHDDWASIQLPVPGPSAAAGGVAYPQELTSAQFEAIDAFFPDPPCLADLDANMVVDTVDFLALLAAWGSGDPAFDIAPEGGDGQVDVLDFLAVLASWGPCP